MSFDSNKVKQGQKMLGAMPETMSRYLDQFKGKGGTVNVGEAERWASMIGGGWLALSGLRRNSLLGLLMVALGGDLIYRGLTAHCSVYASLGVNTAKGDGKIKVERSITIDKSPEEIYSFWRNFENLPRFMKHLKTVDVLDNNRSHWVTSAPAGTTVEWDAEITNERENEVITWRSLPNAQVTNIGAVRFLKAPEGRGTEVRVNIEYIPPAGPIGAIFAKLFGEEPSQQVLDDLRHLKEIMEAGEIPTIKGQPNGKRVPA